MQLRSLSVHYIFFYYIIHLSFFLKLDTVCPFSPDLPVKGQLTSYIESLVSDATQKALSLSYGHLLALRDRIKLNCKRRVLIEKLSICDIRPEATIVR